MTFNLASGVERGDPERTARHVASIFRDSLGNEKSAEAVEFAKENGYLYFVQERDLFPEVTPRMPSRRHMLLMVDFDEVTAVQFVLTFDWKPHVWRR